LAVAREIGNPHLVARNQLSLATALLSVGDSQAALIYTEEALNFFRGAGDRFHMAWGLGLSGEAYTLLGQLQAGRKAYLEALRVVTDVKDLPLIAATLEEIGGLESFAARHYEAMHLMGAALSLKETTGASLPRTAITQREVDQVARQAIGDEAVERALAEGRRMTLDEAVDYATRLLAT
jgi:tetratricopeptide (TPR) repeat protein